MLRTALALLALAATLATQARAHAQAHPRQDVTFQVTQTTVVGQSVFVLGDLPELGANDLRQAVKLEPSAYPVWRATISLPAGRSYSYRYYTRTDAAGQGASLSNGTPVSDLLTASTTPVAPATKGKLVAYHTTWTAPVLNWRQSAAAPWQQTPMTPLGPARTPAELRMVARLALPTARPGDPIEFYITSPAGRDPATGSYSTPADAVLLQDGSLYTYIPAPAVSAPRRDYNPASPPAIQSAFLDESRRYRVFLPRGYDQHTTRRYPVLYMHDGQNVFETGPFGSWNAAQTITALQRSASMREIIVVAADNGPNRLPDYAAPDAGGWSDARYFRFLRDELKPLIDAQYRTIPAADVTGAMGSSMGGQASLYMGWDMTAAFTRVGAMSGALQVYTSGFYNRVRAQPVRQGLRLYLDSGDAGTASDNYWPILNLRDNLLARPASVAGGNMALSGNLWHVVGQGQQHNEAAWAARLPAALRYLYPVAEEPADLRALWIEPSQPGPLGVTTRSGRAPGATPLGR